MEITNGQVNARLIVTNLTDLSAEEGYEFYCQRGEQENRIKELKLELPSGRTSCHRFLASHFRLLLHAAASVLMRGIQDALHGTRYAGAQVDRIRLRLLKAGAQAKESLRAIWFHLSRSFPEQAIWQTLHERLAVTWRHPEAGRKVTSNVNRQGHGRFVTPGSCRPAENWPRKRSRARQSRQIAAILPPFQRHGRQPMATERLANPSRDLHQ